MNVSILEAARTKFWDLGAEDLHALRDALLSAIGQTSKEEMQKQRGYLTSASKDFSDRLYVDDATWVGHLGKDDQLINVVTVAGPITRSGGACSYGSIDHYHQVEYANSLPQTVGHIFLINTPGGAASARMDYVQAIQESRALGKPCVAFIDGMCCSAGMFIASQCDLIIVRNPKNEVGCIGTMVAFYTQKDGDTHQLSQERYVEITAEESPDKNLEYRKAAEGDYSLLKEELSRLTTEFQEMVRAGRPSVADETLTGKVYAADEVMGQLVDEVGSWRHAINSVFALADDMSKSRYGKPAEAVNEESGNGEPAEPTEEPAEPAEEPAESQEPGGDPDEPNEEPGSTEQNGDMECQGAAQEPEGGAAATEEPAATGEEPTGEEPHEPAQEEADASIRDAVNAAVKTAAQQMQAQIDRQQKELDAAKEQYGTLTSTIESQAADLTKAQEALQQAADQRNADSARIEELSNQLEAANANVQQLTEQLAHSEQLLSATAHELKAAQATISERDAEIRALAEAGTEAPVASVPASNGQGVTVSTPRDANNVIKPGMSAKEARAAQEARMAELRRKANGC